jgi:hypothetical protein
VRFARPGAARVARLSAGMQNWKLRGAFAAYVICCSIKKSYCVVRRVSVEKVPDLMLVCVEGSRYKQARVADDVVHRHARRPAAHDGT